MRILIVANKCSNWSTWNDKINYLKDWFFRFNPVIDLKHVSFDTIPFTAVANADSAVPVTNPNWQGVDPKWYDEKIMPMAIGYDIVLLVLPLDQWPYNNSARGWRTDNEQGAVQLQIATTEFEQLQWPNFPYMSAFFQLARHEIMHALFMISGQYDLTHAFWNLGKLEMARDMIKLP